MQLFEKICDLEVELSKIAQSGHTDSLSEERSQFKIKARVICYKGKYVFKIFWKSRLYRVQIETKDFVQVDLGLRKTDFSSGHSNFIFITNSVTSKK